MKQLANQNWIEKYKLIEDNDEDILSNKIESLIGDGWQPFGSPFSSSFKKGVWVYQAVVKYRKYYVNDD
jgi:hypothetical protein